MKIRPIYISLVIIGLLFVIFFFNQKQKTFNGTGLYELLDAEFADNSGLDIFMLNIEHTNSNSYDIHFYVEDNGGNVIANDHSEAYISNGEIHLKKKINMIPDTMKVVIHNNTLTLLEIKKDKTIGDTIAILEKHV